MKPRTTYCGLVTEEYAGQDVVLYGWVKTVRDHRKLLFIDLYDREGHVQVLFNEDSIGKFKAELESLTIESCICIEGEVVERAKEKRNPRLKTGNIEVLAKNLIILNQCKQLPFELEPDLQISEDLRLRYRYLDLRRDVMKEPLRKRSEFLHELRKHLAAIGFVDLETPYLIKYTPGGARNFLVPSRMYPGKAYALAESPQIFKQLFMLSGFDRYFQIARCFRDEDLRADRQPEFTQLDIEMSFITEEELFTCLEECLKCSIKHSLGMEIETPFKRISYSEAISKYGTDKPDLRYGVVIDDLTGVFSRVKADFIQKGIESGMVCAGYAVNKTEGVSRKVIKELTEKIMSYGAKGLMHFYYDGALNGTIAKFFTEDLTNELIESVRAEKGSNIFAVMDKPDKANELLGRFRPDLIKTFRLQPEEKLSFCWVTEFPLFGVGDSGEISSIHHPFTAPRDEDVGLMETEPLKVRSRGYDLVLNGNEIGGGSIRIHSAEIQAKIFRVLKLSDQEINERFGFLLGALKYGTPPHGGIAIGVDRMMMMLLGMNSIREMIPFPKTQTGQCVMTGSPAPFTEKQLRDLHLRVLNSGRIPK